MLTNCQTGSYGSIGIREFLHVLWEGLPRTGPKAVRFLYVSDHDAQGLHEFSILKWGARRSAAMSRSTNCPGLQWIGPTKETVFSRLDEYLKTTWTHENRHKSALEQSRAFINAKAKVQKRMSIPLTDSAKSLLHGMERLGFPEQDPVLAQEIDSLRSGKAVSTQIIPW